MANRLDDTGLSYLWGKLKALFAGKASTSDAVKNITRSGTTFTATKADGHSFTFDQQDTWRGIQNNLNSDSTTDSLSAAQGKVLNDNTNKLRFSKQISDSNAFDNTTEMFYDWSGYLYSKTGNDANYLSGMRITGGDPNNIKLLMYDLNGKDYLYNINWSNRTISYIGSLNDQMAYRFLPFTSGGSIGTHILNYINGGNKDGIFLALANATDRPGSSPNYRIRYTQYDGSFGIMAEAWDYSDTSKYYVAEVNPSTGVVGTWNEFALNSQIATLGTEITVTKNDTYVSNDFNFACRKIDSKVLVFDGYVTLSDNVPAYSNFAVFTGITTSRACRMIAVDQENKAHQIYIPNASNAITTREYIPSGTILYFSGTIII